MSVYIVGDIQGCFSSLEKLLIKAAFNPHKDTLWACGDLIGRGTQALETLRFLHQLGVRFQTVLGNHDLHFLAVAAGIKKAKVSDGFDALLAAPDCPQFIDWLRQFPLAARVSKGHYLSHAGLYPLWRPKEMLERSEEVSTHLRSPRWQHLLANMYGNQERAWSSDLRGQTRLNFIINALTRMRFIYPQGTLEFGCKSAPLKAPSDLIPWFEHPALSLKPHQHVYFGHWAALQGRSSHRQIHALDTGCVWGGKLTMLRLSDHKRYSVDLV